MSRKQLLVRASTIALACVAITSATTATANNSGEEAQARTPSTKPQQNKSKQGKPTEKASAPAVVASTVTVADTSESDGKDIVVSGIRNSLAQARETKRRSESIMDVVEAEDIGKLPNNTVGDVIASIPGINVYRREGEVDTIRLRGLGGVQTTIGGTPVSSGADRVASIADLPADLVKSVEIYKTRTPDQVEGSGGGTINIQFRTPADFKQGFTFSGNAQGRYNNQARRVNQTYTGIVNYRIDTDIGSLGVQFGGTVNHNPFLESQANNDLLSQIQTRQVTGPNILPVPTLAPSQVNFTYTTGARTTPSINGALEWKQGEDDIVLEGNYASPKFDRFTNRLFVPITIQAGSTNNLPALSNIMLVPGTNRLASATVSPVTQIGPISNIIESTNRNYLLKLTARHSDERFNLSTELSTTGDHGDREEFETRNRFVNRPTYDVEFASAKFRYPMMNLQFRDLDLLDPNQYRFFGVNEYLAKSSNRNLFSRVDLTLRTFTSFIDNIKVGFRFTDRQAERHERQRLSSGLQISLFQMPEGFQELVPIAKGFEGTGVVNNARWLSYDRTTYRTNYNNLRQLVGQFFPVFLQEEMPENLPRSFTSNERSIAAYATLHYAANLIFPIDGIIGARVTNWFGNNLSYRSRSVRQVTNGVTSFVNQVSEQRGRANYVNVEPTVTSIIHFTPEFQARLSYNIGIIRPGIDQISPYISLSDQNFTGFGGNIDLRPEKTTKYDAIFEYYFSQNGLVTINPFYWKTDGSFTNFSTLELVEGGAADVLYLISRPYNAGKGYRRGIEVQAQGFFTFLPGILKYFGGQINYTFIDAKREFTSIPGATNSAPVTIPVFGIARHVGNLTGLFERGSLSARVSYNYNGKELDNAFGGPIRNSSYILPREWMDAAINYTVPNGPLKNLGFSVQVQNVLASTRRSFYGYPDQPRDVIFMARTYGGTIRYRF